MSEPRTTDWTGLSGRIYTYWIYTLPISFLPGRPGNYIYAKADFEGNWQPIYIGRGDLDERANNHPHAQCLQRMGATHFHCHENDERRARLTEQMDLLANYPRAFQPDGCSEHPQG